MLKQINRLVIVSLVLRVSSVQSNANIYAFYPYIYSMSEINYSLIAKQLSSHVCPEHSQFATVVSTTEGVRILGACCQEFELTLDKAFLNKLDEQIFGSESELF